jgi:hypothetical protein
MWDKYHPGYFGKVRSISVLPAFVCALWGRMWGNGHCPTNYWLHRAAARAHAGEAGAIA